MSLSLIPNKSEAIHSTLLQYHARLVEIIVSEYKPGTLLTIFSVLPIIE